MFLSDIIYGFLIDVRTSTNDQQHKDSSLSLKKGSRREVILGRQERNETALGQPGQYTCASLSLSLYYPFVMSINYPMEK